MVSGLRVQGVTPGGLPSSAVWIDCRGLPTCAWHGMSTSN